MDGLATFRRGDGHAGLRLLGLRAQAGRRSGALGLCPDLPASRPAATSATLPTASARGDRVTERAWWLLAASGWLAFTWGVAEAGGWYWWPMLLGAGALVVFLGYAGLRPLALCIYLGAEEVWRRNAATRADVGGETT